MSWSVARSYRLNTVSHAVTVALFCACGTALPSTAQAATLGAVQVHSAQNEPLSASITVNDVDVAHFSAYLAGHGLYQEMGLTPNPTINARFVADSLTQGRIVISSTQPIAMPFADIVLTLNNNGDRDILPKTLLMPLQRPALMHTPLMVQNSAPPALNATPTIGRPIIQQTAAPLLAQQSTTVKPLSVIVSDVMPPMPNAASTNIDKAPLLAQQTLTQTPLIVTKTSAMPPMPRKAISNPAHPLANASTLLAQQQAPQNIQPITMQQPVRLDSALDKILTTTANTSVKTAQASVVPQPLQVQRLTALPALPNSKASLDNTLLFAKSTTNPPQNLKATAATPISEHAHKLPAATESIKVQTKRRIAPKVTKETTSTPNLQAATHTASPVVNIETTRRITRTSLPKPPVFLDTADNSIARTSTHDMLDDAVLTDLADVSQTVARLQTPSTWSNSTQSHTAPLIKNQKAIELNAHLQELRN